MYVTIKIKLVKFKMLQKGKYFLSSTKQKYLFFKRLFSTEILFFNNV